MERWIEAVIANYDVLPLDAAAFRTFTRLMHGRSNDLLVDAMIAATAQTRNLIVVTRDTADFETLGVSILNPFLVKRS